MPCAMAKRLHDVCVLPECIRPRAQQRGQPSRNQIEQDAQQLGHCSGRGRPHSAVIALGGIANKEQAPPGWERRIESAFPQIYQP